MTVSMQRQSWPVLLLGLVLVLVGLAVVSSGELTRRDAVRSMDAMGGEIIDVLPGGELQGLDGRLVRVHGKLAVDRPARDRQFGVMADTATLTRTVEMQQWREIKDRHGSATYVRNWFDHPIDSSQFDQPSGHVNPPFPFRGASFAGGNPTLAGLLLGPELRQDLPGQAPVAPDFSTLPANLTASFRLADGKLWSNVHPGSPKLGDLRLSWTKQALRELSVVARVEHQVLTPAPYLPSPGYVLMVGDVPLNTMMPGIPELPGTTWLWRILGLLLAVVGAWVLLAAWQRKSPNALSALSVGVLPVALVAAILWLGTRWLTAGLWFGLAVLAAAVLAWTLRSNISEKVG